MVTLLCVVSGSLDAISFLAFGEAFASVMTGNIVFMGVAAGTRDADLAIFCGVAVVGYAVGGMAGSRLVHRWRRPDETALWPARVTRVLSVQLAALLLMTGGWIVVAGEPRQGAMLAFLAGAASMMGVQGAAIRAIGVAVSTTYMTGALTTLLEAVVTRRRFSSTEKSARSGILALLAGALLGSLALSHAPRAAMVVPSAALAAVVMIGYLYVRSD